MIAYAPVEDTNNPPLKRGTHAVPEPVIVVDAVAEAVPVLYIDVSVVVLFCVSVVPLVRTLLAVFHVMAPPAAVDTFVLVVRLESPY
jgi:hypothetical protein